MPEEEKYESQFAKLPTPLEMALNWKNPRRTNGKLVAPSEAFAKELPEIGSKILVAINVQNETSFSSVGITALVKENTEDSVWFETCWGAAGIICTCSVCATCWRSESALRQIMEERDRIGANVNDPIYGGYSNLSHLEAVMRSHMNDSSMYQVKMIGHLAKFKIAGQWRSLSDIATSRRYGANPEDLIPTIHDIFLNNKRVAAAMRVVAENRRILDSAPVARPRSRQRTPGGRNISVPEWGYRPVVAQVAPAPLPETVPASFHEVNDVSEVPAAAEFSYYYRPGVR